MALGFQPRGLFGRKPMTPAGQGIVAGDQPPVDWGDFAPPQGMGQPQEAPAKPGLFGQGGVGRAIAGSVGDALLQYNDMAPIYAPTMERNQELAARQREASTKRELDWQDYIAKQEYEAAHPKAANNDTLNDMAAAANWTPEQWAIYDKLHPVYRVGPDGIPYPMARGGSVPTAPVGKLTPIGGGPQVPPAGNFP